ncbi:Toprim domain-containing protein [Rhodospirillales bacterium URHD0017]|nr:Toprim domain-containing protein [Rhodospirillales bacterium URHD0017]
MTAADIAQVLGNVKRNGAGWLCRCPVDEHKKSPRPLSIRDGELAEIVVHCFAGCTPIDVLRALNKRGLLDERERRERRPYTPPRSKPGPAPADPDKPRHMFERFGKPIRGTPVETYLRKRCGDDVMLMELDAVLRFWPETPPHFPWPAMVALVTDLLDATRVQTLHFTDLLPDGSGKAPITPNKRTLKGYPAKGGVIRLVDDAEITTRLGIAEGIEKSLAMMTTYRRECGPAATPIWSGLNASVMGGLPVLPVIEQVVIYSDPNPAGRRAAAELVERYSEAGIEVFVGEPPNGCIDWDEVNNAA